jgi:hypothetical protein
MIFLAPYITECNYVYPNMFELRKNRYLQFEFLYFHTENFMTGYNIVFDREKMELGWKASNCEYS